MAHDESRPRWGDGSRTSATKSMSIVTDGTPDPGELARLLRFGRPSSYSLSHAELAGHVRELRRQGWQHWEIRTRFDFGSAA